MLVFLSCIIRRTLCIASSLLYISILTVYQLHLAHMGKDNLPVYTLISSTTRPQKAPSPNYLEVIRTALEKEAGLKPKEVKNASDDVKKYVLTDV